jgi:hypothetical protein
MPIQPPQKSRIKAKAVAKDQPIDWLALWALSLGASAIGISAIAYFTAGDRLGAAFVLTGTAAIIALVLAFSSPPARE